MSTQKTISARIPATGKKTSVQLPEGSRVADLLRSLKLRPQDHLVTSPDRRRVMGQEEDLYTAVQDRAEVTVSPRLDAGVGL